MSAPSTFCVAHLHIYDDTHPDWVLTLHLHYTSKRKAEEDLESGRYARRKARSCVAASASSTEPSFSEGEEAAGTCSEMSATVEVQTSLTGDDIEFTMDAAQKLLAENEMLRSQIEDQASPFSEISLSLSLSKEENISFS